MSLLTSVWNDSPRIGIRSSNDVLDPQFLQNLGGFSFDVSYLPKIRYFARMGVMGFPKFLNFKKQLSEFKHRGTGTLSRLFKRVNPKYLYVLFLAFAFVVPASATYYYQEGKIRELKLKFKQQEDLIYQSTSPKPSLEPTPGIPPEEPPTEEISTEGWVETSSFNYYYILRHPPDWYARSTGVGLTINLPTADHKITSYHPDNPNIDEGNLDTSNLKITFFVHANFAWLGIDVWFNQYQETLPAPDKIHSRAKFTLSGEEALRVDSTDNQGKRTITIYAVRRNKVVAIQAYPYNSEKIKFFDATLNTFVFASRGPGPEVLLARVFDLNLKKEVQSNVSLAVEKGWTHPIEDYGDRSWTTMVLRVYFENMSAQDFTYSATYFKLRDLETGDFHSLSYTFGYGDCHGLEGNPNYQNLKDPGVSKPGGSVRKCVNFDMPKSVKDADFEVSYNDMVWGVFNLRE